MTNVRFLHSEEREREEGRLEQQIKPWLEYLLCSSAD